MSAFDPKWTPLARARVPRNRLNLGPLLLLLLPGPALAHGSLAVLLFPVGIVTAIAAILLLGARRTARPLSRVAGVIVAIAAPLLVDDVLMNHVPLTALWCFAGGFLPGFALGLPVLWLFRKKSAK